MSSILTGDRILLKDGTWTRAYRVFDDAIATTCEHNRIVSKEDIVRVIHRPNYKVGDVVRLESPFSSEDIFIIDHMIYAPDHKNMLYFLSNKHSGRGLTRVNPAMFKFERCRFV